MTSLRFAGPWPWWLALAVALIGSLLIWRWYRLETHSVRSPMHWLLPTLRAGALFLALLMLAGPTLHHRWVSGELSRIAILLDTSASMELIDPPTSTETVGTQPIDQSRFERSARWLTGVEGKGGVLSKIQDQHHVLLSLINVPGESGNNARQWVHLRWDSATEPNSPRSIETGSFGLLSPIGDALAWNLNQTQSNLSSDTAVNAPAATILISDGQNNSGAAPDEIAKLYQNQSSPIFTIGVGSSQEPNDVGVVDVVHSKRVSSSDRIQGTITLKEQGPKGSEYTLRGRHAGRVFLERKLRVEGTGLRRIDFDVEAAPIFRELDKDTIASESTAIPIHLQFELESTFADSAPTNDRFESSLWGLARRNRVLLLDPRGRWETRYIKNALDRDPAWELSTVMGPAAFAKSFFPETRSQLFDFDLLILAIDALDRIGESEQTWMRDFVEQGGGLILIDGGRDPLDGLKPTIQELLPFDEQHLAPKSSGELQSMKLTAGFVEEPAFVLKNERDANVALWNTLPVPKSFRNVSVDPGAETILEGRAKGSSETRYPLMITKYFGQGRVLYSATDETWRWRYNVADLYHQRLWNQLAEWTMRAPFAMKNDYVALDTGALMLHEEENVTVRAKLKREDGTPLENASAFAILERDGVVIGSIPLTEESSAHGFYRAVTGSWPAGDYTVRVEVVGVPNTALQLKSPFRVLPPVDLEMQSLACNVESLQRIAGNSGGAYFPIEEGNKLLERLEPLQRGKVVETQTNLWQSYPWFITIIVLLALEWYLRKQAGLI